MVKIHTNKKQGGRGVNLGRGDPAMSDGTHLSSDAPESTLRMGRSRNNPVLVTPMIVFNILSAVMPKERAKVLAGYSGKTSTDQLKLGGDVALTVEAIRERLQRTEGITLADEAIWLVKASGVPEEATSDQISARKQLHKIMGYEAAQKVEMNSNHRHEIVAAVAVFRDFNRRTGLNPRQLKLALQNFKGASPAEVVSEPTDAEVIQMVSSEIEGATE